MRWPWVRRTLLSFYRSRYNEATRENVELRRQIATAEGARDQALAQLERADRERTETQMRLLRLTLGLHPFPEDQPAQQQAIPAPQETGPSPIDLEIRPGMKHNDVQALFVNEGMARYGNNVRRVKQHVDERLQAYYSGIHRPMPQVATADELDAAARVAADVEAAIAEGAAAAAKG